MSEQTLALNEDAGYRFAQSITDDVVRNLVLLGIAKARMRFIRQAEQTDSAWRTGLPAAPFDMLFYAKLLASVFERPEVIRSVLAGKTVEQAAGWDI